MNKKGFTLVELLAVIIILALLALLASTAVTKTVKDSKQDLYENQKELIRSGAEAWGASNMFLLPDAGTCTYITLLDLKESGLFDSNAVDPRTNTPFSDELKIKISTTYNEKYGTNKTIYEVEPENIDGCLPVYTVEAQS